MLQFSLFWTRGAMEVCSLNTHTRTAMGRGGGAPSGGSGRMGTRGAAATSAAHSFCCCPKRHYGGGRGIPQRQRRLRQKATTGLAGGTSVRGKGIQTPNRVP